jgi:hypothetical protein
MRTETDPVSETSCQFFNSVRRTKSRTPAILSVLHQCWNPLDPMSVLLFDKFKLLVAAYIFSVLNSVHNLILNEHRYTVFFLYGV